MQGKPIRYADPWKKSIATGMTGFIVIALVVYV